MNDEGKEKVVFQFSNDGNVKTQQTEKPKNNQKSGNKNKKKNKNNNNNSNNNQNTKKKKQQQNQKNNQNNKKKKQQQNQKNNQKKQKNKNNNNVAKKEMVVTEEVVNKVENTDDFIEILDDNINEPVEEVVEATPETNEDYLQLEDGFVEAEDLSYRPGIDFMVHASDNTVEEEQEETSEEDNTVSEEINSEFGIPSKEDVEEIVQRVKEALENISVPSKEEIVEVPQEEIVQEEVKPIDVVVQEDVTPVDENDNFTMTSVDEAPYDDDAEEEPEQEEVNLDNYHDNTEINSIQSMGITVDGSQAISPDDTFYRDKTFAVVEEDPVVEEIKEAIESHDNVKVEDTQTVTPTVPVNKVRKVYLSFQARVLLLVVGILLLFSVACFVIISALTSNNIRKVGYVEKTTIHYDVCKKVDNPLNKSCLKEGDTYTASDTDNIHVNYHYEALFAEKIDYELSYHVVVVNKIYDHNDKNKLLYEDEVLLLDKIDIKEGQNPVKADVTVEIDYEKYYKFINEYRQKYSKNADSQLNVILYLDDKHDTRNVGEVIIPLTESKYKLTKNELSNDKAEYPLAEKDWTNKNTVYIVVGSVFVILSLFLLFHLTRLALAVTGKKSKYQDYLMDILNEYDRFIVIARDGYETNVEKKIVKVYSFEELLNIRNNLNKPIIYSRINSVKSEFIIEDDGVIYKFILKEADMGV